MPARIQFGTDGWRAIIAEDFTFENVRYCAQAVADYLHQEGRASAGLVVGYDTRFASDRFAAAVAEVAAANDVPVYLCNRPEPTPVVSYAVLAQRAAGGVVITSSHNPAAYNGFKYKSEYAGSAAPEVIAVLEERIRVHQAAGQVPRLPLAEALKQERVQLIDARPPYLAHLRELVDLERLRASGLTLVHDAMFGAGMGYFAALLDGGRTRVINLRDVVNPNFPGLHAPEPIPANLAPLLDTVRQAGADLGIGTDGDADRIGLVDERGVFVNQLEVYALLLLYLLEVRGLRGPAVRSLTSTAMADRLGARYGIRVIETPVGFKYVGPRMVAEDAILGGEESGGYGFRGHIPERDAILAGLYLLDLRVQLQRPFSAIVRYLHEVAGPSYYDRHDVSFPLEQRAAILARVQAAAPERIAGLRVTRIDDTEGRKFYLEDGSWLLIRFSGTEPLLRIYTEATRPELVDQLLAYGHTLVGI
ncbi:MAG TPA: phosphoglucomutase/phosphomannomutase family protein [Chloroflexota bacterium]|nr:phosphoglucomutase/phosphomannomutase family protein [Chloroflexota bacterium]